MSLGPIGLEHYLVLGAVVFAIGLYGALAKRNTIAVLMGIELMLNAVNLTLVAFSRYGRAASTASAAAESAQLTGQVFALFVIAVAAAEAAVALALVLAVYRSRRTVNLDEVSRLHG